MKKTEQKKRILFVVDVIGWAYDDAARHWKTQFSDVYDIDIIYLKDYPPVRPGPYEISLFQQLRQHLETNSREPGSGFPEAISDFVKTAALYQAAPPVFDHTLYDGLLFFYSRSLRDTRLLSTVIPAFKTAVLINNEKWQEEGAGQTYDLFLRNSCNVLLCNNRFIYDTFKPFHDNTFRTTQGVDPDVFHIKRNTLIRGQRPRDKFTVGWSGDYQNPLKNIGLVKAACEKAGVKLLIAKNKTREELNNWYNKLDLLLCMSESEGGPLMLLEAGACGIPVITTPVGLAREIIRNEHNGIITGKNPDEAAGHIIRLAESPELRKKIAGNIHHTICNNWTYDKLKEQIRPALAKLVNEK